MQIATLDFESYWDTDYSLTKLSPLEYVMGERFELISVAIKVNDWPTDVFFGEDNIKKALNKLDWSDKAALGHNMSGFDSYIMAYRLGINPKMWLCTAAMARPIHAKTCGVSLAKLVEHYGLGRKDNTVLLNTKGKRLADFTKAELDAMSVYNKADTEQCYALFKKLRKHYAPAELWQIDAITRMRTEPKFQIDVPMLETALSIERDRKRKAIFDLAKFLREGTQSSGAVMAAQGVDELEEVVRSELASAPKFAALLTAQGVEVPMKPSPTNPEKQVPALAKTDEAFVALQNHDNQTVAAAARARLAVKSTLLETRIGKFITAANLAGGRLPVPLRFCGADTTGRDSGEEYNCQNLPAIRGEAGPAWSLRNSMKAPPGHSVIVADQSGIELRVNHFLWMVPESMALYAADPQADLYKAFAAVRYGVPVDEVTKPQRQLAKIAQLGLGFGAGWATFMNVARLMGGLTLDEDESRGIVEAWRAQYAEIVSGWRTCHAALSNIDEGIEAPIDPWGLLNTSKEGIHLPSGRIIRYPQLRQEGNSETGRNEWIYATGRHKARIYAGKITENCVQALARDSIFDCAVEYFKLTGLRPALRVHDELVYVVPTEKADELLTTLQRVMRSPPKWWPQLVVWSEGDKAASYGAAK